MKKVWIFNHFGCTPKTGTLLRHYNFSKFLKEKGYQTTVFASNQLHFLNKTFDVDGKLYKIYEDEQVPFVFIKTPKYDKNGFDRIKNWIAFFIRLPKVTKKFAKEKNEKPDVIIASSVHPLTCVAGIFIAKRYKVPCVVEIRDLWPESLFEYSKKLKKDNLIIKILCVGEKWIYKKADKIIFTRPADYDYIIEKKWEKAVPKSKCFYINNGIDLEETNHFKSKFTIKDADLDNLDIIKITYCGAIRHVNGLAILLDVAKEIKNEKIKFIVWGDGDLREILEKRLIDEKITNVVFKGSVEKKYIPYILSKSDINLLHNTQTKLLRFGISWNKLFDYYASKKPIVTTLEIPFVEIDDSVGRNVSKQDPKIVAKAINEVVLDIENISKNAEEKFAQVAKEYDFKVLTDKLIKILEI